MNKIEEEFYKTFGIEPIILCDCEFKNLYDYSIAYGSDVCIHAEDEGKGHCKKCKLAKQTHPLYPEITDRILLELLALINNKTLECMKKQILTKVIGIMSDNPYKINQIQSLFREGEE